MIPFQLRAMRRRDVTTEDATNSDQEEIDRQRRHQETIREISERLERRRNQSFFKTLYEDNALLLFMFAAMATFALGVLSNLYWSGKITFENGRFVILKPGYEF